MTEIEKKYFEDIKNYDSKSLYENKNIILEFIKEVCSEKEKYKKDVEIYQELLFKNAEQYSYRSPEKTQKTIKDIIIQTLLDSGYIKRGIGTYSDTYIFLSGLTKTFTFLFENKLLTEHSKPDMFFSFCFKSKKDKCIYSYASVTTIKTEFSRVKNKFYPKQKSQQKNC